MKNLGTNLSTPGSYQPIPLHQDRKHEIPSGEDHVMDMRDVANRMGSGSTPASTSSDSLPPDTKEPSSGSVRPQRLGGTGPTGQNVNRAPVRQQISAEAQSLRHDPRIVKALLYGGLGLLLAGPAGGVTGIGLGVVLGDVQPDHSDALTGFLGGLPAIGVVGTAAVRISGISSTEATNEDLVQMVGLCSGGVSLLVEGLLNVMARIHR